MKSAQSIHTFLFIDAARISNFIHRNSATVGQRMYDDKQHATMDTLNYEPINESQIEAFTRTEML